MAWLCIPVPLDGGDDSNVYRSGFANQDNREMRWEAVRRIGLLTSDFALYHDLVRALRERGVPFASLAFRETPDPGVGVVITSWRDAVGPGLPKDLPIVVVPVDKAGREDVDAAIAQAQRTLEGVEGYAEVIVGVDPGHRPGVALLADGRLLQATQVFRVKDVAPLVRSLFQQYPHDRGVVRVGHGAPQERDEILRTLWPLRDDGVRVEIVDETGTTPETGRTDLPPDVAAAILIARTPGQPPSRQPRTRLQAGQVKEMQRTSRIASGGRVTISREAAERVLRGERTMAEAIADETRKPPTQPKNRRASS
jgi:hypothetical protein